LSYEFGIKIKELKLTVMKKLLSLIVVVAMFSSVSLAQRFVYVDTEYILDRMPDYKKAQEQIDVVADGWRKEVDAQYKEIERLYKAYQAEQVLLTEEMKIQKQQEIENKEKAARELQKRYFGFEGELFIKKQELVKPIQDKVYKAIQDMAESKVYDFVFDKSNGVAMLFATPKYDRSDDILKALGITNLQPTTPASSTSAKPGTSTTATTTPAGATEEKKQSIDMKAPTAPGTKPTQPNQTNQPSTRPTTPK
jgi:outer membrane protein